MIDFSSLFQSRFVPFSVSVHLRMSAGLGPNGHSGVGINGVGFSVPTAFETANG
jgi:hypothetical protein